MPLNSLAHLLSRLRTPKPYRRIPFLAYLAGIFVVVLVSGALVENDPVSLAIEISPYLASLPAIIYAEYFVIDWIRMKIEAKVFA